MRAKSKEMSPWLFKLLCGAIRLGIGFLVFTLLMIIIILSFETSGLVLIFFLGSIWGSYKVAMFVDVESRLKIRTARKSKRYRVDKKTKDKRRKPPRSIHKIEPNKEHGSDFLATVTIDEEMLSSEHGAKTLYTIPRQSSSSLPEETFIGHDELAKIAQFEFSGPVYLSQEESDWGVPSSHRICLSSHIREARHCMQLSYWPNYQDLEPEQRYLYLKWLSEGKGLTEHMGFVFLYFYGLEHYVISPPDEHDFEKRRANLIFINKELVRLKKLYPNSRSLVGYANNLQDLMTIEYFPESIDTRKHIFPEGDHLATQYAIARYSNEYPDKVIDFDWAFKWLVASKTLKKTKLMREQYKLVRLLFKELYEKAGGIVVPKNKKTLKLIYRTCASNGGNRLLKTRDNWSDPFALKKTLAQLAEIASPLMSNARKISKAITAKDKLQILASWPKGNESSIPKGLLPTKERLQSLAGSGGLVPLNKITSTLGFYPTGPLTSLQKRNLAEAIETIGLVMVPDVAVTHAKVSPDDTVYLYPGQRVFHYSKEGEHAAVKIRFATTIARADHKIDDAEKVLLETILLGLPIDAEGTYLSGLLNWRLVNRIDNMGFKQQIEKLNDTQKDELMEMSLTMAEVDGAIENSERKAVLSLLKKCGFSKEDIDRQLAKRTDVPDKLEEAESQDRIKQTLPVINTERLKAHQASTMEVQQILGKIFDEDIEEELMDELPEPEVKANTEDNWYAGALDEKHAALCEWLITKESWPREAVAEHCKQLELMEDGAIETINEAAFDLLGDSLIEPGDPYFIYLDILDS